MSFSMIRKRLAKEREIGDRLILSGLHESDRNTLWWDLSVSGPAPYEGKTFVVRIEYESGYPFRPPFLTFQTPIFHPNITLSGQSSNIFIDPWSPTCTIQTLYDRIQYILQTPIDTYGYNHDAMELYHRDLKEFARVAAAFPTSPTTPSTIS